MADSSGVANGKQQLVEMRSRIVEAAAPLLESEGKRASVEDIAKAAGLSVPVAHQFLKKPADIMLLIMENLQQMFLDGLGQNMDEGLDAEHKLTVAIRQYYAVVDSQAPKVVLVYRGSRTLDAAGRKRIMQLEMEAVDTFRAILDEGVASGVFKKTDTDLVAYNITVMGHLWALKAWHFKRRQMNLEDFIVSQIENVLAMVKS